MSSIRQAKRCPQCGTMTQTETSVCQICGHLFRSDVGVAQPTFNPERTQMLGLPASALQHPHAQQTAQHEPVSYIEPVAAPRRAKAPLVATLVGVMVILVVVFYLMVR